MVAARCQKRKQGAIVEKGSNYSDVWQVGAALIGIVQRVGVAGLQ